MSMLSSTLRMRLTSQDARYVLLVLPPIIIAVNYWLFGEAYFNNVQYFVLATLLTTLLGLLCWYCNLQTMYAVRRWYPAFGQTWQRVLISEGLYVTWTGLFTTITLYIYHYFHILGFILTADIYLKCFLTGILSNIISGAVYEILYTIGKWQDSLLEAERLKKANLQSQFESLKSQVNPHFLFNSLNSLSSLISDNPQQAEQFLDEMSKVYRYLLRSNNGELTSLSTELKFIRSYFHLLKTRYGDGISLDLQIDPLYDTYLLPPLTLQMLVENAVKHNVILKEQPLQICIETNLQGCLTVRNNLQKKQTKIVSNGIGLNNILSRYQLLGQSKPLISNDGLYFSVQIPLIQAAVFTEDVH